MHIPLNLGSYTRKSTCHGKTPELCWICSPNHELNHQLLGRAINCNVTGSLCAGCHHNLINAIFKYSRGAGELKNGKKWPESSRILDYILG